MTIQHQPYGQNEHGGPGYTVPQGTSIHYRYGYVVGDAPARYCGITGSSRPDVDHGEALRSARSEAKQVAAVLAGVGAPADVSAWVQKIVTTIRVAYDAPELEPIE